MKHLTLAHLRQIVKKLKSNKIDNYELFFLTKDFVYGLRKDGKWFKQ